MKFLKMIALPIAALSLFLAACNSDVSKPATSNNSTAADAAPVAGTGNPASTSKPELYLYEITADNLLLRDRPSQQGSQVVSKFKLGDLAEGNGEASPNQENATIRGIDFHAPFLKVRAGDKEGWAFGAALLNIYAGSRAEKPDMAKLAQFTGALRPLNTKALGSGKKAWAYVQANFSAANGPLADAAFIITEAFLRRTEIEGTFYTITEKVKWTEEDMTAIYEDRFDMAKYPETKSLAENGFRLETGEGMVFPVIDWQKFQAFFGPKVTPPMRAFIDQRTKEMIAQAYDDGGVIIPLEQLADRAAFWEKFNRDNPYFPLKEETQESQRWMKLTLTNGADNTPTADSETGAITEDFKKVWAYVQATYPGTEVAAAVKKLADLAAAEGWKRTKKVEALQAEFAKAAEVQ